MSSNIDELIILSTYMDQGGAGLAAQRWQEALGVKKVLTIKDANPMRLKFANFLLRIESKVFSKFWNRSLGGPTSISLFGALSYRAVKEMRGTFFVHWVQNNFISLYSLFRIRRRCIFYCHDEWSTLGIGHYSLNTFAQRTFFKGIVLIKRSVLNHSILVLVPTVWLKNQLLAVGVKETKICVFPNPVSNDFFCPTTLQEAEIMLKYNKTRPILTFIAHSVKDERKGLNLFLSAIDHISQKSKDFVYLIVGSGSEIYADNERIIAIKHVSSVDILKAVYAISDCVVVPSLIDNFPQVATEAQSSGTRVVVSSSGGTPETIVSRSISGDVVDVFDTETFANVLIRIAESSWTIKNREDCRRLAYEEWSNKVVEEKFYSLIQNI